MPLLTIKVSPDRAAIDPETDNRLFVVCELSAKGDGVERERPHLDAMLTLDVSGSMKGPPLEQVIASVGELVDFDFQEKDRVGIIAFSSSATTVSALETMNDAGKRLLRTRARRLDADGQTAVEAGLVAASQELAKSPRDGARRAVLLLSDGAPNVGASSPEALAEVVARLRQNVSVSTLGYGVHHNEDILARVADAGGGRYFFVQDPQRCQHEFAMAVGTQADMVTDHVELSFKPASDVKILRVLGASQTGVAASGLTVSAGDMTDGQRRLVAVEIEVPKSDPTKLTRDLVGVRVSYNRAGSDDAFTAAAVATIELRKGTTRPHGSAACQVFLLRAEETRAAARALADRGNWDGAAAALRKMMKEMEDSGLFVKGDASELADVYELLLDEAMAMERRPSVEQYQRFRKDAVRSTLYTGTMESGVKKGKSTRDALSRTAGLFPEAYLVEVKNPLVRHRLGPQCTLGRTREADIVIISDRVSRRHADVYALAGEFWVCDLGSTNTTTVNGKPLGAEPHKLAHGDVLELGGEKLRYEEVVR